MNREWTDVKEVLEGKHTGSAVNLRGWIHRARNIGNMVFLNLRDSTGVVQIMTSKDTLDNFDDIKSLLIESSIKVKGEVAEDQRAPGGYEIKAEEVEIVHKADVFPIQEDYSVEHLLEQRHLWLRSTKMMDILTVRSCVFGGIHEYFRKEGYKEFQSPILTPLACEGGSTLFPVDYFDDTVYLAQSWQLYAEAALFSIGSIYTIAPSFRAEKSRTPRHLTEYWHAEVEAPWLEFEDLLQLGEGLVYHVVQKVLKECREELLRLRDGDISYLENLTLPFPRITYQKTVDILQDKGFNTKYGDDFGTPEEKALIKHFEQPVFVTHYPKEIKAFYMKRAPEDDTKVLGFDLIVPVVGELIGGSERETEIESLESRLKEEGEDLSIYQWFLDTRRFGSVPHGGYGLGVERLIMWLCSLDHIRDAIPFPRTPNRYRP
ncbi:MAG: asparagine--tRNA ligase [Thermoplasmata archaeon]